MILKKAILLILFACIIAASLPVLMAAETTDKADSSTSNSNSKRVRDAGITAAAAKNYIVATSLFREYQATSLNNPENYTEATILLTEALFHQDLIDAAEKVIVEFHQHIKQPKPSADLKRLYYLEGHILLLKGDSEKALELLNKSFNKITDGRKAIPVILDIGDALFRQDKYEEAKVSFRLIKDNFPNSKSSYYAQLEVIKIYLLQGRLFWAKREIDAILKKPDFPYPNLAQLYNIVYLYKDGKTEEAYKLFSKNLTSDVDRKDYNSWWLISFNLAKKLTQMVKYESALNCYKTAKRFAVTDEQISRTLLAVAETLALLEKSEEAVVELKSLLEMQDRCDSKIVLKATLLLSKEYKRISKHDETIKVLKSALKLKDISVENSYQIALLIAEEYAMINQIKESIDAYILAASFDISEEQQAYALYQATEEAKKVNNLAQAKSILEKFTDRFQKSSYAEIVLFSVAEIDQQLGNNREAIAQFKKFLEVFPDSPRIPFVHQNLTTTLLSEGLYEDTIKQTRTVLKSKQIPARISINILLTGVDAAVKILDFATAIELLNYAKKYEKNKFYSYVEIKNIQLLFLRGSDQLCIDKAEDFIKRHTDDLLVADAYFTLADLYNNAGDFSKAFANYQNIVNKFPTHKKAPDALISAIELAITDNKIDALPLLQFFIDNYASDESINYVKNIFAYELKKTNKLEEAEKIFIELISNTDVNSDIGIDVQIGYADLDVLLFHQNDKSTDENLPVDNYLKSAIDRYLELSRTIPENHPKSYEIDYKLGKALLLAKRDKEAILRWYSMIFAMAVDRQMNEMRDWKYPVRAAWDLTSLYIDRGELNLAAQVMEQVARWRYLPQAKEAAKRAYNLRKQINNPTTEKKESER